MRLPLAESAKNTSVSVTLPPPIGGWNARDPISAMKKTDAIYADNVFPRLTDVISRKGYSAYADVPETPSGPIAHNIRSFLPYNLPSGISKLYAANGEGIYDVTTIGSKTSAEATCTNGEWNSVNITTAGGNFLWACNGVDKPYLFDGTTWVALDSGSSPALTGITSTDVVNVSLWKHRLILTELDSLSFWYLGLNSVSGAATEYPLGALFRRGGYLMATDSWTIDAGEGADDYFLAITSQGELAVFKGTDPSSASTFALVGIFQLGKPLSRKCFLRVGGDVYLLLTSGLIPLSKILISGSFNRSVAVSDRIVEAWNTYATNFFGYFGWQAVSFPRLNMILVNVPIKFDDTDMITYSYQFVMNTVTGAWSRFTAQNSACWCEFGDNLYFATENYVRKAWDGGDDNGLAITVNVKQAYSTLTRAALKHVQLVQFIMHAETAYTMQLGIDVDYEEREIGSSLTSFSIINDKWDTAVWDTAKWAGQVVLNSWKAVNHNPGRALSLRLKFSIRNANMSWSTTNLIVENLKALL